MDMIDHPTPVVSPSALGRLQEYVAHRELLRMPAAERAAQVRALLERTDGLGRDEARRLWALFVADGMTYAGNIGTPGTDGTMLLALDHLIDTPDVLLGGQQALTRQHLAAWRIRDLDAATLASRVRTALATPAPTTIGTADLYALAAHPARDEVLASLEPLERIGLARTWLEHRSIDVNRTIESIAAVRPALRGVPLGASTNQVVARVLERLEAESLRMGREAAPGAGFGHHPDYSQLGRISADLGLVEALEAAERQAAPAATLAW
jgi:hypothetical protein